MISFCGITRWEGTEFPSEVFQSLGYESVAVTQKAYNGVAILSRHPMTTIVKALIGDDSDSHARFLEVIIKGIRIVSGAMMTRSRLLVTNLLNFLEPVWITFCLPTIHELIDVSEAPPCCESVPRLYQSTPKRREGQRTGSLFSMRRQARSGHHRVANGGTGHHLNVGF